MKEIHEYEKDIASIRSIMEKSGKFISLSGMSGILAGIYALCGAVAGYFVVHYPISPFHYRVYSVVGADTLWKLILIAAAVLGASIVTGLFLSQRKAKKSATSLWSATSRQLFVNLAIPLITGGIFILIILYEGHFGLAAPASLIFYGLALIHASQNTYDEVRYLGFSEIGLGLISAVLPGYGLLFWALGFGVLHILYGGILYNKYDR
ncbi:hypothetical protein BH09BAC3_BH09BAC3_24960 [soil metagenome]